MILKYYYIITIVSRSLDVAIQKHNTHLYIMRSNWPTLYKIIDVRESHNTLHSVKYTIIFHGAANMINLTNVVPASVPTGYDISISLFILYGYEF